MSHQCYVCQTEKGLDECVGCHQLVCKTHTGHVKQYISIDGRKGRGCQKCIDRPTKLTSFVRSVAKMFGVRILFRPN